MKAVFAKRVDRLIRILLQIVLVYRRERADEMTTGGAEGISSMRPRSKLQPRTARHRARQSQISFGRNVWHDDVRADFFALGVVEIIQLRTILAAFDEPAPVPR